MLCRWERQTCGKGVKEKSWSRGIIMKMKYSQQLQWTAISSHHTNLYFTIKCIVCSGKIDCSSSSLCCSSAASVNVVVLMLVPEQNRRDETLAWYRLKIILFFWLLVFNFVLFSDPGQSKYQNVVAAFSLEQQIENTAPLQTLFYHHKKFLLYYTMVKVRKNYRIL